MPRLVSRRVAHINYLCVSFKIYIKKEHTFYTDHSQKSMNCILSQMKVDQRENEYASLGRTLSCLRVKTIPLFVSTFYSSLDDIEDIGYSK